MYIQKWLFSYEVALKDPDEGTCGQRCQLGSDAEISRSGLYRMWYIPETSLPPIAKT